MEETKIGWVRSRLEEVRRLKRQAGGESCTLVMPDGTRRKFSRDDFIGNFKGNTARLRALYLSEKVPPPHPLGQALSEAIGLPPELESAAEAQRRLDRQVGG